MSKGDGPFQILETINDNAYKVDLSSDYGVSAIFNIFNISLFNVDDESRSNPFQERWDDASQITPNGPLEVLIGTITRLKAISSKMHSIGLFRVFGPR